MKLRGKFSFIILLTIFQSFVLTVLSIINLRNVQSVKDYQNMEIRSEEQLSSIIDYLEKMDYWDFDIENAYSTFAEKKDDKRKFVIQFHKKNPVIFCNKYIVPQDF